MAPNAKKILVDKIAKEQNLDTKQLWKMSIETLRQMDKVVPDTDGADILGDDTQEGPKSDVLPDTIADQVSGPIEVKSNELPSSPKPKSVKPKVKLGYHPVTGLPVYSDDL